MESRVDEEGGRSCDPCGIAEDVSWAFGRTLVRRFPRAESGDPSPGATFGMDRAGRAAAEEWIRNNVLPQNSDDEAA